MRHRGGQVKRSSQRCFSVDQLGGESLKQSRMSSSKADPRRPDKIVPYHLPSKSSGETDWAGNVAMAVGKSLPRSVE